MWIRQISAIFFLLSPAAIRGRPIDLHNYAPAHDYKSSADYSFSYGVKDLHTGDVKHQWEKRDGDTVRGHYSILEPDGSVRTVDYTVGEKSGFNAVVKHTEPSQHPTTHPKSPISHHQVTVKSKPHYESTKTEHEDGNEVQQEVKYHLFVPQEEEAQQESIDSKIQIPAPNRLPISYQKPQYYIQQQQLHQNDEKIAVPKLPIDLSYFKGTNYIHHPQIYHDDEDITMSKLPVDLSFIKGTTEKIIPIDVKLLNPVEIDLSQHTHQQVIPSRELTHQELNKFLQEYYNSDVDSLNKPQLETGFRPITKPTPTLSSIPLNPQTFRSNKKPMTTPGLRNFASKNPKLRVRGYNEVKYHI